MNNLQITLIDLPHSSDDRGTFTKIFTNESIKLTLGLDFPIEIKESYYTFSKKNVIRGMHFQTPPHDHHKIVHVIKGKIIDVVLDIKKESPTYGKYFSFDLSEYQKQLLFIPKGFAHGFHAIEDCIVQYYQTTAYAPAHDEGIKYNSFSFPWSIESPIISLRDLNFKQLKDFQSPF